MRMMAHSCIKEAHLQPAAADARRLYRPLPERRIHILKAVCCCRCLKCSLAMRLKNESFSFRQRSRQCFMLSCAFWEVSAFLAGLMAYNDL